MTHDATDEEIALLAKAFPGAWTSGRHGWASDAFRVLTCRPPLSGESRDSYAMSLRDAVNASPHEDQR